MRHRLGHRKLNRNLSSRRALLRGLASQLIEHERIVTTLERAKELRKVVEPLIARARVNDDVNRRFARRTLYGESAILKLFQEVGPLNAQREGGYTRILKLGLRPGDNAKRVAIELVQKKSS